MKELIFIMLLALVTISLVAEEAKLNAEIIKVYREELPAVRFIGKKYLDEDRVNHTFGTKWDQWFENSWFDTIKNQVGAEKNKHIFDKVGETIGLMKIKLKEEDIFEYWIGMFVTENTTVPEGFSYVDFPPSSLGVCWVQGVEPDIYWACENVIKRLRDEGYEIIPDSNGSFWSLESYISPRFTTPDENGKIILDRSYYVK